jgi:hypothetical protein
VVTMSSRSDCVIAQRQRALPLLSVLGFFFWCRPYSERYQDPAWDARKKTPAGETPRFMPIQTVSEVLDKASCTWVGQARGGENRWLRLY